MTLGGIRLMPVNVSIVKNGNHQYIRVCQSYRNEKGQPTSRVIENHGRLDLALLKDPQYVEKLRERVKQQNELEKKTKIELIAKQAAETMQQYRNLARDKANTESFHCLNIGMSIVKKLWNELSLPATFRYLDRHSRAHYSYNDLVFYLCMSCILAPGSKLKNFYDKDDYILDFNQDISNLRVLYRVLDRLSQDKTSLVHSLGHQVGKLTGRKITAAFYDVTTYEFESQSQSELKDFGLSKANKVNEVQVVMGLLMDENGIPVDYELFKGNTSEFSTLCPIIERLKQTYDLQKVVVVADRGLNSNENLSKLLEMKCYFVIAQKIKNLGQQVGEKVRTDPWDGVHVDTQTGEVLYQWRKMEVEKPLYETTIDPASGKKTVNRNKETGKLSVTWLVTYSEARAHKDLADLNRKIEKAQKALSSKQSLTSAKGYKGLIKVPKGQGKPELNLEKIRKERQWAGYYAICTNLSDKKHDEIMKQYRQLWRIEDCFRTSKSYLEARPCFVWTDEHINGHFLSCYISLVIEKLAMYLLKQKLPEMTEERFLSAIRQAQVLPLNTDPLNPVYLKVDCNKDFDQICEAMGLGVLSRCESRAGLHKKLKIKGAKTM